MSRSCCPVVNRQVPYPPVGPGSSAGVKVNRGPLGRIGPVGFPSFSQVWRSRGRWRVLVVGDGHAPGGPGVTGRGAGQVAGQVGVDGPMPPSSPGRSARPSRVAAGTVRVSWPANPGGITPAAARSGAGAGVSGPGVRRVPSGLCAEGPGVHAEQDVQEGAGAQHVHPALQPGRAQLLRPRGHPLIRGQHLRRRQLPPGQPRVPATPRPTAPPGSPSPPAPGACAALPGATSITARAIAARSAGGVSRPARPSTIASAARASSGSSRQVARAMTAALAGPGSRPGTPPWCRAGLTSSS